ncbi:restriction endonuclease subunit S [Acinetobacter seifertii]|uniref:Restriction endonuclease subunit S n=1 Tax=Acinetobacter seifertii TaxID=1530123 RepID=A0A5E9PEE5_9GAMM|nr:restriction endonuclease subunit S [Acinetobacter seifertii]TEU27177.1 restriction endonuclease subunit S [Acinetobacter seifertii]
MSVPKLRFKEFDGDWDFRKIGDISDSIVPGRNKPKLFDGDIPWVTTPDIKDKIYVSDTQSNYYISEVEAKNVGSKIVPTNSVIMSCVGDLGLFVINTKPIVINQQLHAFLLDNSKYSSVFVLNALSKNQNFIEKVATKTALPYLNKDNCNSIPLFLCSFEEQTEIASFFSAVDEKISQMTQKHELLSQYKQGMMQKLFSQQIRFKADDGSEFGEWEENNFSAQFNFHNTNSHSRALLTKYGEIMNIHYGDIHTKFSMLFDVNKECIPFLNNEVNTSKITKEQFLKVGDLVIADASEDYKDIGKAIEVINLNNQKVVAGLHTYIARPIKPFALGFCGYMMQSFEVREQIKKLATGISVLGISKSNLGKVELRIPCLEEQTKIANFLAAIDQKIEVVAKQIEQAKQWKKGLLQQLFV